MSTMLKRYLLNLLEDKDFALKVSKLLIGNNIKALEPKNAYILVMDTELSEAEMSYLRDTIPADVNFTIISAAQASLIELQDLTGAK